MHLTICFYGKIFLKSRREEGRPLRLRKNAVILLIVSHITVGRIKLQRCAPLCREVKRTIFSYGATAFLFCFRGQEHCFSARQKCQRFSPYKRKRQRRFCAKYFGKLSIHFSACEKLPFDPRDGRDARYYSFRPAIKTQTGLSVFESPVCVLG